MSANSNMGASENSQHHQELGRHESSPSFVGASSSSNYFARINSPSVFGTKGVLPTHSVQHISAQRNLGIPLQQDTEPVGHGVNLPEDVVPVPVPVQNVGRFIYSGRPYATVSSGSLSSSSQCFPCGLSSSSSTNTSNNVVFNTSSRGTSSGSSCASSHQSIIVREVVGRCVCMWRNGSTLLCSRKPASGLCFFLYIFTNHIYHGFVGIMWTIRSS
jgi:two-component response regulator ARR-B family